MTTWYLIIILFNGSNATSSQQTVEFANQAQCEVVRDEIREKMKDGWFQTYIECRSDR